MAIRKDKILKLEELMRQHEIYEKDLKEKFVRSQGAGGQNVNKVATCVQITHIPTDITVKCDKDRSQSINRFLAKRLLVEKIIEKSGANISSENKKLEKIKKQKQRRKKRAQKKYNLED